MQFWDPQTVRPAFKLKLLRTFVLCVSILSPVQGGFVSKSSEVGIILACLSPLGRVGSSPDSTCV